MVFFRQLELTNTLGLREFMTPQRLHQKPWTGTEAAAGWMFHTYVLAIPAPQAHGAVEGGRQQKFFFYQLQTNKIKREERWFKAAPAWKGHWINMSVVHELQLEYRSQVNLLNYSWCHSFPASYHITPSKFSSSSPKISNKIHWKPSYGWWVRGEDQEFVKNSPARVQVLALRLSTQ